MNQMSTSIYYINPQLYFLINNEVMVEVSKHIRGWINCLSDIRMCHMKHFIHPVRELIKDETMSSDEKIEKIKVIIENHLLEHHKINPKDYGVNVP